MSFLLVLWAINKYLTEHTWNTYEGLPISTGIMANQFFSISNVTGFMVADIFLMMLHSLGYDCEGDK